MAGRRSRAAPALVPGYERVAGPLRHYREVATGKELSRRQYQQKARGYVYEKTSKGRTRDRARKSWLSHWVEKARTRFSELKGLSKSAILKEWRRLGLSPPHHASRKPSPGEAARQEAFLQYMQYPPNATRQYYPVLLEGLGSPTEGA